VQPSEPAEVAAGESRTRLVVQLTQPSANALTDLVQLEQLNKTTIVNKALQLYALLRKADLAGGEIQLLEPGDVTPQRLRFI
jgi:hypothetical protein